MWTMYFPSEIQTWMLSRIQARVCRYFKNFCTVYLLLLRASLFLNDDLELTNKISQRSQDDCKSLQDMDLQKAALSSSSFLLLAVNLLWQGPVLVSGARSTPHSMATSLLRASQLSTEPSAPGPGASSHHSPRRPAPRSHSQDLALSENVTPIRKLILRFLFYHFI